MKVFISWSGNKSHKVAIVFREWLPSVIQSLEPYVSSEDIDKGARWSTDIAKELENSTFGILCVTKENLHAPWLSFEAGALSKTMDKSFVTPFLFDIKRSEVNGPILQFQSTIFDKEDIKKLVQTLNKACGESGISESMLDKAFEVWYPTLEKDLNELHDMEDEPEETIRGTEDHSAAIIEEILELTRDNQKLLRNPDSRVFDQLDDVKQTLDHIVARTEGKTAERQYVRRNSFMLFDELIHGMLPMCENKYAFMIVLNVLEDDYPWLYSMGKGLIDIIESNVSAEKKFNAVMDCRRLIDFTFEHNTMRNIKARDKENYVLHREHLVRLHDVLFELLFHLEEELKQQKDLGDPVSPL